MDQLHNLVHFLTPCVVLANGVAKGLRLFLNPTRTRRRRRLSLRRFQLKPNNASQHGPQLILG